MTPTPGSRRHDPDDPDVSQAMRVRRLELGLDVPEMARAAGVTVPTWRNYEAGRTRVRSDKVAAVWDALGWEPPIPWYAGVPDSWNAGSARLAPWEAEPWDDATLNDEDTDAFADAVQEMLASAGFAEPDDADRAGDAEVLGIPDWDDIPEVLEASYSPLLASTLDERAARCFAVGAHVYDGSLAEDLEYLAAMPRGTHLGELDETHIGQTLPQLWLTRYDYELVFQLRTLARLLSLRLTELGIAEDEPLAHTPAEVLVVHDILLLGAALVATRGVEVSQTETDAWDEALCGAGQHAARLIGTGLVPAADDPDHVDNWFKALPDPFVPAWGAVGQPHDDDATVTPLRRRRP